MISPWKVVALQELVVNNKSKLAKIKIRKVSKWGRLRLVLGVSCCFHVSYAVSSFYSCSTRLIMLWVFFSHFFPN